MFHVMDIFISIISSYFYAYVGTNEIPPPGDPFFRLMIFFEVFFGVSMIIKFFLEIRTSETAVPIRNHKKIAEAYL